MRFIKFLLLFVLLVSSATAQDPHSGENPGTSVFAPIVPVDPETGDELDQTARVEELKDYVSTASSALSVVLVSVVAVFFAFFVIRRAMGWAADKPTVGDQKGNKKRYSNDHAGDAKRKYDGLFEPGDGSSMDFESNSITARRSYETVQDFKERKLDHLNGTEWNG